MSLRVWVVRLLPAIARNWAIWPSRSWMPSASAFAGSWSRHRCRRQKKRKRNARFREGQPSIALGHSGQPLVFVVFRPQRVFMEGDDNVADLLRLIDQVNAVDVLLNDIVRGEHF